MEQHEQDASASADGILAFGTTSGTSFLRTLLPEDPGTDIGESKDPLLRELSKQFTYDPRQEAPESTTMNNQWLQRQIDMWTSCQATIETFIGVLKTKDTWTVSRGTRGAKFSST